MAHNFLKSLPYFGSTTEEVTTATQINRHGSKKLESEIVEGAESPTEHSPGFQPRVITSQNRCALKGRPKTPIPLSTRINRAT